MRQYHGVRQGTDTAARRCVYVIGDDGMPAPLDPRLDIRNHSPTGFNWGYAGSGPAQLALALCADALGDDRRAERIHQHYKFAVVARWPQGFDWTQTQAEVISRVEQLEGALARAGTLHPLETYGPWKRDDGDQGAAAVWETNDRLTDGELAQKYGVTKQAVQKRREKEGWARDPSALIQRATAARLAGVPLGRPRPEEEGGGADGPGGEGAARAPAPPAAAPRARADAIAEEAERRARLIERHRTEWLMVDVALKEAFDQRNGTADARGSRTPGSFEPFKRAKIIAETLSIKQAAQRRAWGIDDPAKLRLDLPDATQDMGNARDRLLSRLLALRERGGDPGAGGGPHG